MKIPQRMCVSCRKRRDKNELIRIANNENFAVIDNDKRCSSRAIYVCYDNKCIDTLKKNNAINRFLKVNVNDELFEKLKSLIEEKNFD